MWWKEKTNSSRLSSDLHKFTVAILPPQRGLLKIKKEKKKEKKKGKKKEGKELDNCPAKWLR